MQRLAPYRQPDDRRAIYEIAITLIPFAATWGITLVLYQINVFLMIPGVILAGALLVRVFMLQHDCGHGTMFSSMEVNNWVGRCLGVITMTPYDYWRRAHALHHSGSGNLDRRGFGDIDTLTIAEYRELGFWGKLSYRVCRHPLVLFGIGPAYVFLLQHRLPLRTLIKAKMSWWSVLATNLGIVVVHAPLIYFLGWSTFFAVQIPIVMLSASMGVWLFYIQHQFDETHWEKGDAWSHENAALEGSSFYDLPKPIMWMTGNIGIHHVHHLSSRIPFHRLPQVLEDHPELREVSRLTFWESLKCIPLALWDEEAKRLISFRDYNKMLATA